MDGVLDLEKRGRGVLYDMGSHYSEAPDQLAHMLTVAEFAIGCHSLRARPPSSNPRCVCPLVGRVPNHPDVGHVFGARELSTRYSNRPRATTCAQIGRQRW